MRAARPPYSCSSTRHLLTAVLPLATGKHFSGSHTTMEVWVDCSVAAWLLWSKV